jgi:hypothetical protein
MGKIFSLKKTPFAQSSVRFKSDGIYKSKSAPGPGQYRIPGFAEENLRKSIIDASRKAPFGNSEQRKFELARKDQLLTPGPAQYTTNNDKMNKSKKENYSSTFASTTKRDANLLEVC